MQVTRLFGAWASSLLFVLSASAIEQRLCAAEPVPVAADTFTSPDGDTFYVVSLKPQGAAPATAARDVVVMFDTSASQVDAYRDKGLEALNVLLTSLGPNDRVRLMAVDLTAIPLTADFVGPASAEMQRALTELRGRVPLGSTDMEVMIESAAGSFARTAADRSRAVVYIGDGMSTAQLIGSAQLEKLTGELIAARAALTSYAIGPRTDGMLLGALAANTGGLLAIDNEDMNARQIGVFLASAAMGPVVWPVESQLAEGLGQLLPRRLSPLRYDRETILIGRAKQAPAGDINVTVNAGGAKSTLTWTVTAKPTDADNAYLAELVQQASRDGGVSLPLVGTPGLREVRNLISLQARAMVRLGKQAAAMGNLNNAKMLNDEALRLDAGNPEAESMLAVINRQRGAKPANARELKLVNLQVAEEVPAAADAAPVAKDGPQADLAAESELLDRVRKDQGVRTGKLQAEVQATIQQARGLMSSDPDNAANLLKLQLEGVRSAPELAGEIRLQLGDQLESALREASRQSQIKAERELRAAAVTSEAEQRQQLNRELVDRQSKKSQLMERFNALMDERRYGDAKNLADTVRQDEPATPVVLSGPQATAQQVKSTTSAQYMNIAAHQGIEAMLMSIQQSAIMIADDPPVVYPDPEVWRMLTEKRKKYKNVDLARNQPAEVKIINALSENTELEFIEAPLTDVVEYLKTRHNIEIQLDNKALEEAAVAQDTPITRNLKGIALRSALRLMLRDLDLTYVIRDEVLLLTTKTAADSDAYKTTKVYPVADLVIPIRVTNPLQGGLGGGMGGGTGGAGGGMGGGGGGGGGGFGGGGGGMFAVKDELKLSSKKPVVPANPPVPVKVEAAPAPKVVAPKAEVAAPKVAAPAPKAAPAAVIKPLDNKQLATAADLQQAWNDHFATHEEAPAAVRETVRGYMQAGKPEQVIAIVNAAIRNKQSQPWMYEALGLAMQLSGALPQDVERALMSAIDFTSQAGDMIAVADYLLRAMPGNEPISRRALKLYRQASSIEPLRPEPLVKGLALSQQINDIEGIEWSASAILSQAWTKNQREIPELAQRIAVAAYEQLQSQGRKDEAVSFKKTMDEALARDLQVVVSWTGEADIDLLAEEPPGTVCSFRNPRTTSGGTMLGESNAAGADRNSGVSTESYVCPQGFNGTYKMQLRRVWGKPTVDRVTVDYYVHRGTPQERHLRKTVNLVDGEAAIAFELQNGRRQQALAQEQIATAVAGQVAVGKAILAQQLAGSTDPGALNNFLQGAGGGFGAGLRGAVGYQPVIITLPTGANFNTTAVVSADRRYVRITSVPFFSSIPRVDTFNYAAGSSGTSGGATGGT